MKNVTLTIETNNNEVMNYKGTEKEIMNAINEAYNCVYGKRDLVTFGNFTEVKLDDLKLFYLSL